MANGVHGRCFFPLTSLQIGDLQSYLSHLTLFLAPESGKLYILVDNRPWLEDLASRSTHIWQLMVTKSRLSPFANSRGKKEKKMETFSESQASSPLRSSSSGDLNKWFSVIDSVISSRERALLPVKKLRNSLILNSKLHGTLYGFIVFEVAWKDVRGINYLNELQTDTSLAIETKVMRRWEFDSIDQAARCICAWFPGTVNERVLLKDHLNAASGDVFSDAQESFPRMTEGNIDEINCCDACPQDESQCSTSSSFSVYPATTSSEMSRLHTPPLVGPYKRRKVMRSCCDTELEISSAEEDPETVELCSQISDINDSEETVEAALYTDVLILVRFNDRDLPFKLKVIITSDLKLLTLHEAGLPSWVLFFQSYPGFCHLYRPWMCPLARYIYVLISIVTVLIGFYDLYKNVPLLKSTASHLFGPLFDWIETWEMISRIKYLGTMLFLHNFQKSIKWVFMLTGTTRSVFSFFIEPIAGPFVEFLEFLLPVWNMFMDLLEGVFSVSWEVFESLFTAVGDIIEIILLPIWFVLLSLWNVVTSFVYPIFWILSGILCSPFRLVFGSCTFLVSLCTYISTLVLDIWAFARGIFQFTRNVESTVKVSSYEVSMWRSLWNDLFSQVFRALRVVLNGFVAFAAACNRHRLSIYNYVMELIDRFLDSARPARITEATRTLRICDAHLTPGTGDESFSKMRSISRSQMKMSRVNDNQTVTVNVKRKIIFSD